MQIPFRQTYGLPEGPQGYTPSIFLLEPIESMFFFLRLKKIYRINADRARSLLGSLTKCSKQIMFPEKQATTEEE